MRAERPTSLQLTAMAIAGGALLASLAGCAGSGQPTVVPSAAPTASSTPTASAEATPPGSLDSLSIALEPVVTSGLEAPVYAAGSGDGSGRLFVVEQPGRIRVIRDGSLASAPFLDLTRDVEYGGERGLLGLAFAPDYAQSGRFFVDYTRAGDGATVIAVFVAENPASDSPKISGGEAVLTIPQPYANHNGGCLQFGPDGCLYIGMGDGGSAGDPQNRAQNPRELLGKMLRIDVRTTTPASPKYRIPPDNPYATRGVRPGKGRPEIYALGVRNPWRFSFDTEGGDLWIGDVGQNAWEEVDHVTTTPTPSPQPLNFGWRLYEGTHPFDPKSPPAPKTGLTFPVIEYGHDAGEAVIGGYVYRGAANAAMYGIYLYADEASGKLWGYLPSGGGKNRLLLETKKAISSFGTDDSGELYAVDLKGGVYHITAK